MCATDASFDLCIQVNNNNNIFGISTSLVESVLLHWRPLVFNTATVLEIILK